MTLNDTKTTENTQQVNYDEELEVMGVRVKNKCSQLINDIADFSAASVEHEPTPEMRATMINNFQAILKYCEVTGHTLRGIKNATDD